MLVREIFSRTRCTCGACSPPPSRSRAWRVLEALELGRRRRIPSAPRDPRERGFAGTSWCSWNTGRGPALLWKDRIPIFPKQCQDTPRPPYEHRPGSACETALPGILRLGLGDRGGPAALARLQRFLRCVTARRRRRCCGRRWSGGWGGRTTCLQGTGTSTWWMSRITGGWTGMQRISNHRPPHLFCKLSLEPALRAVGLELLSQSPKMRRRRRESEYRRRRRQKSEFRRRRRRIF
eukprot:gene22870-biopygen10289